MNDRPDFQAENQRIREQFGVSVRSKQRPKIGKRIVAEYGDGKFHKPADIAVVLGTDEQHVTDTLTNMIRHKTFGVVCERGTRAHKGQFRIFRNSGERMVSSRELNTKLRPLVSDLLTESRKHAARFSPMTVRSALIGIERLLDEWTKPPEPQARGKLVERTRE